MPIRAQRRREIKRKQKAKKKRITKATGQILKNMEERFHYSEGKISIEPGQSYVNQFPREEYAKQVKGQVKKLGAKEALEREQQRETTRLFESEKILNRNAIEREIEKLHEIVPTASETFVVSIISTETLDAGLVPYRDTTEFMRSEELREALAIEKVQALLRNPFDAETNAFGPIKKIIRRAITNWIVRKKGEKKTEFRLF